eukprot:s3802_g3.t1
MQKRKIRATASESPNALDPQPWGTHDVTHVEANREAYDTAAKCANLPAESMNELVYALEYAPLLSKRYLAEDIRARWFSGEALPDFVALIAGKAEDTKTEAKIRETLSADDIHRAFLSEYDVNDRFWPQPTPPPRRNLVDKLMESFKRSELNRGGGRSCPVDVTPAEASFMVHEVWFGRSALNPTLDAR